MSRDRRPKPITPEDLRDAAVRYLERFSASAEGVRRVLNRRVQRAAAVHDIDRETASAWIDALIARLVAAGALNDEDFAEARTTGLHRRGASTRRIRETLAAKGVSRETVDRAVERLREEVGDDTDFHAAIAFAKRRRLGPFRALERRASARIADLAALARAGFDRETARRVVDAADADQLMAEREAD